MVTFRLTILTVAGATPGLHFPESRFYVRRVRLSSNSELVAILKEAGYPVLDAVGDEKKETVVVEIPVDVGSNIRTLDTVSMWEQLAFASFLQAHWADNQVNQSYGIIVNEYFSWQVSCTVTFDPIREGHQLSSALDLFQYQLKGISFLPRLEHGAYPQMPYEAISREMYEERAGRIKAQGLSQKIYRDDKNEVPDKFCDASGCSVDSVEAQKESKR